MTAHVRPLAIEKGPKLKLPGVREETRVEEHMVAAPDAFLFPMRVKLSISGDDPPTFKNGRLAQGGTKSKRPLPLRLRRSGDGKQVRGWCTRGWNFSLKK